MWCHLKFCGPSTHQNHTDEIFACQQSINGQQIHGNDLIQFERAINCTLRWMLIFIFFLGARGVACPLSMLPASYWNHATIRFHKKSFTSAKSEADCRLRPFKNQLSVIIFDFFPSPSHQQPTNVSLSRRSKGNNTHHAPRIILITRKWISIKVLIA